MVATRWGDCTGAGRIGLNVETGKGRNSACCPGGTFVYVSFGTVGSTYLTEPSVISDSWAVVVETLDGGSPGPSFPAFVMREGATLVLVSGTEAPTAQVTFRAVFQEEQLVSGVRYLVFRISTLSHATLGALTAKPTLGALAAFAAGQYAWARAAGFAATHSVVLRDYSLVSPPTLFGDYSIQLTTNAFYGIVEVDGWELGSGGTLWSTPLGNVSGSVWTSDQGFTGIGKTAIYVTVGFQGPWFLTYAGQVDGLRSRTSWPFALFYDGSGGSFSFSALELV